MATLVRLMVLVAIAGLLIYLFRKASQPHRSRERERIVPFCTKCESNRHVAANAGTDIHYPQREYAWYCQRCQEGF